MGHFALTLKLYPALVKANGARIVSLSSSGHQFSPVIFEDIQYDIRPYDPWTAYGQSKTANILFAVEASRLWAKDKIMVNAVMPGAIKTNLQRYTGKLLTPKEAQKTIEEGASTSVLAVASPLLNNVSGRYFANCNEAKIFTHSSGNRLEEVSFIAPWALDPILSKRL